MQKYLDQLMLEAEEDWIGLWQLVGGENAVHEPSEADREAVFEMVRVLLDRGLVAGNLRKDRGFTPWANQTADAVVDRIKAAWDVSDPRPQIHLSCWFALPSRIRPPKH